MSWLVDNANSLYILLGAIAAGFVVGWKLNARVKFLGYAAGILVLMGVIWALTLFVVSDSKQLEKNVHAMADAVVAGKTDDLFQHISKDFTYKSMTRDMLYEAARRSIDANRVKNVRITAFNIDEPSRTPKFAKTRFRVTVKGDADQTFIFVTQADFVREGDQWKLKTMRFYNPFVDQDREIDLPGIR